jgi:hypothetical protein
VPWHDGHGTVPAAAAAAAAVNREQVATVESLQAVLKLWRGRGYAKVAVSTDILMQDEDRDNIAVT